MPDANGSYSREEFKEAFGYDPVERMQPEERGGWKDHIRSAAVGALSVPTDLYGAIGSIGPAASALYNTYGTDKSFMEAFSTNLQQEGAQGRLQQHLNTIANAWQQENPQLTQEEINAGIEDYKKSKQFEDFAESQLRHMPGVAASAKGAIRSFLGDERPDSQRSWTESGAEAIGGALVGLPLGALSGGATATAIAARTGNTLINNPLTRGALKTAEVLTPATVPYTTGNVVLNAAAGVALDQGMRYAQGKSTAFTPTPNDSAGVGTLVAGGAGFAGMAAVLAAMKGRAHQAVQASQVPSSTQQALGQTTTLNAQVAGQQTPGTASITSGSPQGQAVTPSVDSLNPLVAAQRRAVNEGIDESAIPVGAVRDIHGARVADEAEQIYHASVGSVLNDDIAARIAEMTQQYNRVMTSMPADRARALEAGASMTSYAARHTQALDRIRDEIADLQQQVAGGRLQPQGLAATNTRIAALQDTMTRVARDDPDARMMLPQTEMRDVFRTANGYIRDSSPEAMAHKAALSRLNQAWRDMDVAAGRMNAAEAAAEHRANPYYTPALHDPLEGAVGVQRMWRAVVKTVRNSGRKVDARGDTSVAREGSIDQLGRHIPEPTAGPETRITSLLQSQGSIRGFLQNHIREVAHTTMRNEFIRRYSHMDAARTIPTEFYNRGHMREITGAGGQTWFSRAQLNSGGMTGQWLRARLNDQHVVPEWQGGSLRLWEFGDRPIAAMLRQEPVVLDGMMRGVYKATQLFKQLTTGYGNPLFPPVGAMYNQIMHMFLKRNDRAFGPLSTALRHVMPAGLARHTLGRVPDPTALLTIPWHLARNFADLFAMRFTRGIADTLANHNSVFQVLRYTMGRRNFENMVRSSASLATWVHEHSVLGQLRARGIGHNLGAVDNIEKVRGVYGTISDTMPKPLKSAWSFYKDLADMIYLTPQRMFYTENMGLLRHTYGRNIPQAELDRLISETRFLGGNMHKMPASKGMRQLEATFPYLTQTKLGAYELTRNMVSPSTAMYVLPTAALAMYGMGQAMYWRTYWNEESRKEFWNRPDHELWRYVSIPTPKLLQAWFSGENPNYSRDLYYDIMLPPDLVGMIAGTGAVMQMMGMLPNNVTPEPISSKWPKLMVMSLVPAMPPVVQALLGESGMKLDPGSADMRGGKLVRQIGSNFRAGPQAESMSNLGQVSNTTSLVLNALLGTFGAHIAAGTDVFLHASKYYPPGADGKLTLRESQDFGIGLRKALGVVAQRATKNVPDVVGLSGNLWDSSQKRSVMTPKWEYVNENMQHIQAMVGMKDHAAGKESELQRKYAQQVGGMPKEALTDAAMIQIVKAVSQYQNPSGPLGKLKKEYRTYTQAANSINSNYNMSAEEKKRKLDIIVQKQQDNYDQQYMAIKYLEQRVSAKFGQYLAPRLNGRKITVQTLDEMARESIGSPSPDAVYSQAGAATQE
jgi:hypothetical protein